VLDLQLGTRGGLVGQRVGDLAWPRSALLLAIRRDSQTLEPTDDTRLEAGDRLSVLAPAGRADELADQLGLHGSGLASSQADPSGPNGPPG
jgi:trk system potassium uptake protein TrkA